LSALTDWISSGLTISPKTTTKETRRGRREPLFRTDFILIAPVNIFIVES
jgi:hypothetical protein